MRSNIALSSRTTCTPVPISVRPAAYANSARPQKSSGPESPGGQAHSALETCRVYSFMASFLTEEERQPHLDAIDALAAG